MAADTAVCIVGPTAAGKTEVAIELSRRFPFDVISVDSAMVYRHMNIGTAKPSADVLAEVPHELIDIREPWESYSAGEFCADAARLMRESVARGRVPLLVGGTLMYFRALQEGLAPLPQADADIRADLDRRAAEIGWPAMHKELADIDPAAAARISANDGQRIQRALEVYQITGTRISELQAASNPPASGFRFVRLTLQPGNRSRLYRRIEQRFAAMMEAGFVDEVRGLYNMRQMTAAAPAMRAVGYRQLWAYLAGETGLAEAERRAVVASRRYAKRQLTWLRADPPGVALDCQAPDVALAAARAIEASEVFGAL